jgi:HEAT repeats
MAKRGRVLIAVAAVVLLAALARLLFHAPAPEPVYQGQPLSHWLIQNDPANNLAARNEAFSALDHIGTNAIPTLLHMMRAYDSPSKTEALNWAEQHHVPGIDYTSADDTHDRAQKGFSVLGYRAVGAVPELIKILDQSASWQTKYRTAEILGYVGPGAMAAVPSLVRAATNTNEHVRLFAIQALGQIHADPDLVIPVLIKGLHDPDMQNRRVAAISLGNFQSDARPAVPALVKMLADPNVNSNSTPSPDQSTVTLSSCVEAALQKIDSETYARVVTNTPPASTR